MPKSKLKPSTPAKSASQEKPVDDLKLDGSEGANVRGGKGGNGGGNSPLPGGGILPGKVSDATLKAHVVSLNDALAKLRELPF